MNFRNVDICAGLKVTLVDPAHKRALIIFTVSVASKSTGSLVHIFIFSGLVGCVASISVVTFRVFLSMPFGVLIAIAPLHMSLFRSHPPVIAIVGRLPTQTWSASKSARSERVVICVNGKVP